MRSVVIAAAGLLGASFFQLPTTPPMKLGLWETAGHHDDADAGDEYAAAAAAIREGPRVRYGRDLGQGLRERQRPNRRLHA